MLLSAIHAGFDALLTFGPLKAGYYQEISWGRVTSLAGPPGGHARRDTVTAFRHFTRRFAAIRHFFRPLI